MTDMPKTKNDIAWEQLFDKYNIIDSVTHKGYFIIASEQINVFRESRLMTKFDHKRNLPQLFGQNKLAILPISRGSYIIAQFEAYHKFENSKHQIHRVSFPDYIQSIDCENITSEATAINTAYVSGILADFTGDEGLFPTVSGRMSSNAFDFQIKSSVNENMLPIRVSNSQVEIDGGYEGINALTIIEAKNFISDDFLVRQLYYPFRLWKNQINKPVRTIFLVYSNGIFSFYEYIFERLEDYNSLSLVQQKNYAIEPEDITFDDVNQVFNNVKIVIEPYGIPFPQANSFKRLINLCELLYENDTLTRDEITYNYDFDSRQTNYYTDAGRYLGIIDKNREDGTIKYFLTDRGKSLFGLNIKARNLKLTGWILEHKPFYLTFKRCLELIEIPTKDEITEIMRVSDLYNIEAESTFYRRASSISGWINWIMDLYR